ncbi:hypothetical protein DFA_04425 [Cavenderia fasciculata]|uniref:Leucine-rich repeat-containing protein n=1 Tax=Cavenderia fasciculata TaxID=261658 RepID=F4PPJ4_CACFS|nr:uncharacterized protein DFA_04425 [Cavenderia fasciculata]EGG22307.1 hypothetical protein DFA_04425 [Cavenderia fasciculata]|eukprot:XP_004360158.1 hypothetical protein DFA_04425 [Cavenderia fasciculata]
MLASNKSITALSIANNALIPIKELAMGFSQNSTITILDLTDNCFANYATDMFTSFLEMDSIQHLIIDEPLINPNHHYFTKSKSLIKYYLLDSTCGVPLFFGC